MKKAWILIIAALFMTAIVGGYTVVDRIFPMAGPLPLPGPNDITSVSLRQNHDHFTAVKAEDIGRILSHLERADPTRTMSVNDYPTVRPFHLISIATNGREYRYFIYEDTGQVYIESPYEGVYRADVQLLDWIIGYCS